MIYYISYKYIETCMSIFTYNGDHQKIDTLRWIPVMRSKIM